MFYTEQGIKTGIKFFFVRAADQWATSLHRPLVLNTIGDL